MKFKLLIYDHNPGPEETAWFDKITGRELKDLLKFRNSHLEPFAQAIEGALYLTGMGLRVKKQGWDVLKVKE